MPEPKARRETLLFRDGETEISVAVAPERGEGDGWRAVGSGNVYFAVAEGTQIRLDRIVPVEEASGRAGAAGGLNAPMPGKVVRVMVGAGDTVSRGQTLMVLEAMKMEHAITAPGDGVVALVAFAEGDQVAEGAELLQLETVSE